MKKCKLFFVPLFFLLLASCTSGNAGGGQGGGDSKKPLNAPVLKVNSSKDGLTWDAVEGAKSYNVTVNEDVKSVSTPGYTFSREAGAYEVSVVAVADEAKYNSEAANYSYKTKLTSLGELSVKDGVITWASLVGMGVEAKLGNEEFQKVEGESVKADESGTYTLHALAGFDEASKTFYVDSSEATKTIEVSLKTKLAAPTLKLNSDKNGLTWDAVEGAVAYQLVVNDGDPITVANPGYLFNEEEGNYVVSIIALSDEAKFNSDASTYSYQTKVISLGELTVENNVITWESYVGLGIQYKVDTGDFVDVAGDMIAASELGTYTVKAIGGFDEEGKIFYASAEDVINTRSIVLVAPAVEKYVMEDGSEETSADVKDKYQIFKYDNGWVPSNAADLTLSEENEGFTENKCVKIKYYKHSADFKYQQSDIHLPGAFDTCAFTIKGNTDGTFKISLKVEQHTYIGDMDINGVYVTYSVKFPAKWTKYSVSLDDPDWEINFSGRTLTFQEVQQYFATKDVELNSLSELLPYFDAISFLCRCPADANWSTAYAYLDDFEFLNTEQPTNSEELMQKVSLKENYAFESDAMKGSLVVDEEPTLSYIYEGNRYETKVALSVEERVLTMISLDGLYDFNAKFTSTDGGATFTLLEASGEDADLFENAKMESFQLLDDFESYAGTGIGFDATHTADQVSGLRAAYYVDFYNGGGGSPVGGNGWSLCSSSDYLDLNKDVDNVHGGAQSGRFKYNTDNQMRFMTFGLSDGTATPLLRGSTFSFWTKGVSTRDNVIKVRLYRTAQVVPGNQDSDALISQEITIPQGSDWMEVKVPIDPNTTYYGFAIYPMKYHGSGQYFFIDDISIYNTMSPWGE